MATPTPTDVWYVDGPDAVCITDEDGARRFVCEDPERFVTLHNELIDMYYPKARQVMTREEALNLAVAIVDNQVAPAKKANGYVHDSWKPTPLPERMEAILQLAEFLLGGTDAEG